MEKATTSKIFLKRLFEAWAGLSVRSLRWRPLPATLSERTVHCCSVTLMTTSAECCCRQRVRLGAVILIQTLGVRKDNLLNKGGRAAGKSERALETWVRDMHLPLTNGVNLDTPFSLGLHLFLGRMWTIGLPRSLPILKLCCDSFLFFRNLKMEN